MSCNFTRLSLDFLRHVRPTSKMDEKYSLKVLNSKLCSQFVQKTIPHSNGLCFTSMCWAIDTSQRLHIEAFNSKALPLPDSSEGNRVNRNGWWTGSYYEPGTVNPYDELHRQIRSEFKSLLLCCSRTALLVSPFVLRLARGKDFACSEIFKFQPSVRNSSRCSDHVEIINSRLENPLDLHSKTS